MRRLDAVGEATDEEQLVDVRCMQRRGLEVQNCVVAESDETLWTINSVLDLTTEVGTVEGWIGVIVVNIDSPWP